MNIEKQYEWSRKGKKYKTKYFEALGQLFGNPIKDNPEAIEERKEIKATRDRVK